MACRRVLAQLREARQEKFPAHPKRGVITSREAAERVLLENEWVTQTAPGLREKVTRDRLREALSVAHAEYARHHAEGTWVGVFSGKELMGELLGWIWPVGPPVGNAAAEDLAKAVAQAQRSAGRVPVELADLYAAIVARRLA